MCAQSCPTLCHPMDCSPPGSSAHGILQAIILEWVAMPSSRGSSQPWDWNHVSCSSCIAGRFLTTEPPGKPLCHSIYYFIPFYGWILFHCLDHYILLTLLSTVMWWIFELFSAFWNRASVDTHFSNFIFFLVRNTVAWASLVAQTIKNLSAAQETGFDSWVGKIPPGEVNGNLLQFSWRIPWTEEPGGQ